ncbi:MAG: molybdenum cofactor guanylyltransferase [Actinomycetota bacterium]
MSSTPASFSAVILCGGDSSRMGRDKATIQIRGKPLVRMLAERMAEVAGPVWLSVGRAPRFAELGFEEMIDDPLEAGPLGGIAPSLERSPRELLAVVGVDMPFANPRLFRLMADLYVDEDIVLPITPEGAQPLHALWNKASLKRIRHALEVKSYAVRDLLPNLTVREVAEDEWRTVDDGRFALNLNRPEDLELLR